MSSQQIANDAVATPQQQTTTANRSWWNRIKDAASLVDRELSFAKGLSVFTVISSLVVGYFQYVSAYQTKVNAEAAKQIANAEATYSDAATQFSKAITLQQYLFFNYRDAVAAKNDTDASTLTARTSRGMFQHYEDLRTGLRENVDMLARKVEADLDWRSNTDRDVAKLTAVDIDPLTRLALGHYDFDCDSDVTMPNFDPANHKLSIKPTKTVLHDNPKAGSLGIDWFSTKHQLLALYYCFEVDHRRIEAAREWAAGSPVLPATKANFEKSLPNTALSFNREAIRLNAFMTLAARRIEAIQVKFRPRGWYCHVPVLREIADGLTGKCSPIHTAMRGSTV
ncbi:MAG TPA: hypothetical protein VN655_13030 [Pseudolabrys sp.]|jgi:hypothetical protein|nr:hypothetical protein [Pseudolabrys sp.]